MNDTQKMEYTALLLRPPSDHEQLVLDLLETARRAVSLVGNEFVGRWVAAHSVLAVYEALVLIPKVSRLDRALLAVWCEAQATTMDFDLLTQAFR